MRQRRDRQPRAGALVVLAMLAALLAALGWSNPAAATEPGQVYLVQGLPGRHVDLYLNGEQVASNVAPKTVVGPLALVAGTYQLRVASPGASSSLLERAVSISVGSSLDAVVHLDSEASPTPVLTVFGNDRSPVNAGKTRLAIAHVAAVAAADIRVDGNVLFSNVANGEGLTTVVPAGSYSVDIVPTGTSGPAVLGPATFTLASGTLTRVFAVGQPSRGTMDAIVQVLSIGARGASSPNNIDTGSGGAAASSADYWTPARIALFAAGALLLAVAGTNLWRRRRMRPSTP